MSGEQEKITRIRVSCNVLPPTRNFPNASMVTLIMVKWILDGIMIDRSVSP